MPRQSLQAAADELVVALDDAIARLHQARDRAQALRQAMTQGGPLREIVTQEDRPLVVELLTDVQDLLADSGGRFRRAEARALHEEGASMERIAALFGVTRQRVSALLRRAPAVPGGPPS